MTTYRCSSKTEATITAWILQVQKGQKCCEMHPNQIRLYPTEAAEPLYIDCRHELGRGLGLASE